MNSYVQLMCLFVSFCYGIVLYYTNILNIMIINTKNILIKLIISFLYILLMSLIFVSFLYKVNGGILNSFIILFIVLGYVLLCVKKRQ